MKIEFTVNHKESKVAGKLMARLYIAKTWHKVSYTVAVGISWIFISFGLIEIFQTTAKVYRVFPFYVVCLVLLFIGTTMFFVSKWYFTKKVLERIGSRNARVSYEVLPDKIVRLYNGGLKLEIAPEDIKKFVDFGSYLFIYIEEYSALYLPLNAFNSEGERAKFKDAVNGMLKTTNASLSS